MDENQRPITGITRTFVLTRQVTGMAGLALAALFALRQSYRARRSQAETTPPEPGELPAPPPHVSIILPVRNEESNIDAVLTSLLAQDYPAFDLTVIDDGSTDATPDLLADWSARDPRLHIHWIDTLPEGWAGKTHALHVHTSTGPLAFQYCGR